MIHKLGLRRVIFVVLVRSFALCIFFLVSLSKKIMLLSGEIPVYSTITCVVFSIRRKPRLHRRLLVIIYHMYFASCYNQNNQILKTQICSDLSLSPCVCIWTKCNESSEVSLSLCLCLCLSLSVCLSLSLYSLRNKKSLCRSVCLCYTDTNVYMAVC